MPTLRLDTYDARVSIHTGESINANRGVARVDVHASLMTKSVGVESILTESVFGGSLVTATSSTDDIVSTKRIENSICSSDARMEGKCPFLDLTNTPLNRMRGLNDLYGSINNSSDNESITLNTSACESVDEDASETR